MAKTKISQYDATAANNTDVANINIAEGCSPSNINNAIRAVMGHLKDFQAGNLTGNALAVTGGGTGAENAGDARTNLGLGSLATLSSVDTAQITADAVDGTKIADDSIDSEHIVDGAIDTVHIGDSQITSAKIANDNVTADELNVSGDGTSGQALLSDGDGSFSWGNTATGSLGANGYTSFSNGLMIQWGTFENTIDTPQTVSFPTSFTTACYCVLTDVPLVSGVTTFTTTTFTVDRDNAIDGTLTRFFIAIGQ